MSIELLLVILIALVAGFWAWAWHEARVSIVQFHYLMSLCRRLERIAYSTGVADGKAGELDQPYIDTLCDMEEEELRLAQRAKEKL